MDTEIPAESDAPPILEPIQENAQSDSHQINLLTPESKQNIHQFQPYGQGSDEPEVSHIAEEVQIRSSEEVQPQQMVGREVSRLFAPPANRDNLFAQSSLRAVASHKKPTQVERRTRSWSAIPDERYEKLIKCLQQGTMVSAQDPDYKPIHRLLLMKRLKLKTVWDVVFNKEMLRVVDKDDEKIVPRKSEVNEILKYYFLSNGQPGPRALCNFANRTYCGIGKHQADEFEFSIDKANRRHGITFKKELKNVPERPMQQVQIDLIDMTTISSSSGNYTHLLTIQCIFSRYFLAEPLDSGEQDLVTHFLMKFFTMFGPPEAYQTYTGHKVVDEAMQDIASQFHIAIHCYGRNGLNSQICNDHYTLRRKILERSTALFGMTGDMHQHWPECIEAALMERNMRIHPFLRTLSPFEVMFGRQPCHMLEPPWLDPEATEAELSAPAPIDNSLDDGGYYDRAAKMRGIASHALRQQKTRRTVQSMELGPETDNTFNLQFLPGDEVYVRNPEYVGSGPRRFLRGVVQDVLPDQEWPYKVQLYTEDIGDDLSGTELFVSPVDITATTKNLEKLRTQEDDLGKATGKRKEVCQCSDMNCRLPASPACPYGYHRNCCRQIGIPSVCKLHHKPKESFQPTQRRRKTGRKVTTSTTKSVKTAPANREHLELKEVAQEQNDENDPKENENEDEAENETSRNPTAEENGNGSLEYNVNDVLNSLLGAVDPDTKKNQENNGRENEQTEESSEKPNEDEEEPSTSQSPQPLIDPFKQESESNEPPKKKKKLKFHEDGPREPRRSSRVKEPPKKLYEQEIMKEEEKRQKRAEERRKERQRLQQLGIVPGYDARYRTQNFRAGTYRGDDRFGYVGQRRSSSFNRSEYFDDYDDYYDYDSEDERIGPRSVVIQQPRVGTKQVNLTVYPPGRIPAPRQSLPATVKVLVASGDGKMEEAEVSQELLQRYKASGRLSTIVVNRNSGDMQIPVPKESQGMLLENSGGMVEGEFLDLNAEGDLLTTSETPPVDKNVIVD